MFSVQFGQPKCAIKQYNHKLRYQCPMKTAIGLRVTFILQRCVITEHQGVLCKDGRSTVVSAPTERATSISPALSKHWPRSAVPKADNWCVVVYPYAPLVPCLGTGPDSNAILEVAGSGRGLIPKVFMIFQNTFRYHNIFFSVSPKRAKNTTAKSGLVHWLSLMLETSPGPADFHSSDVIVGTEEISEWTTPHPGQKVVMPACRKIWTES